MNPRKATAVGPSNPKYDADAARLLASVRKDARKPMKRAAPSAPPSVAKPTRRQSS
jgi:hypothetical protein